MADFSAPRMRIDKSTMQAVTPDPQLCTVGSVVSMPASNMIFANSLSDFSSPVYSSTRV